MTDALPFGTLLGYAPGGVPAYSSDYTTASDQEYPNRKAFRSYLDDVYLGYKWQCVEFARRWMYCQQGYVFDDVAMAFDIFDLRTVRDLSSGTLLPFNAFRNGCLRKPAYGDLLIWQEGGEFEDTGHVAVITEVTDRYVRIAEQNVGHASWGNKDYARELSAKVSDQGEYWITCSFGNAQILGWMAQTGDDKYAEPTLSQDRSLLKIKTHQATKKSSSQKGWLNIANADEGAYVDMMGGHQLTKDLSEQNRYFTISLSASELLEKATNELHGMFMHATDYVLDNEHLLKHFQFPSSVIPKIRQSWNNRKTELITSRFDFALTAQGLKVYEYNCDSASCYMEAAKVQGKWAQYYDVRDGQDAGNKLFNNLVKTWRKSRSDTTIHVLFDDDPEERYHALFMKDAIESAGQPCALIDDLKALCLDEQGQVLDSEGRPIKWVWKTWAWETALDDLRVDTPPKHRHGVQLSDVLLHKDIMVYEPLWSLIPSNKAILPILWTLFPNHPFLLNSAFELTDGLIQSGYVQKPIVGRCGDNITLVGENEDILESTDGQFTARSVVYQELFPLPKIGPFFTQLCTFTASGMYAGSGVRVDKTMIINKDSDCLPLRIVDDRFF